MLASQGRRWAIACSSDRVGAALFWSVLGGNLAHLPYRRDDGTVAGLDAPDADRRGVSRLSVAATFGMPYQTARGRVAALVADGLVEHAAGGLIVPAAVLGRPAMQVAQRGDHDALAEMVGLLALAGYPLPARLTVAKVERLPTAIAARLALDFMLRSLETARQMHGDILNSAIIGGIITANIRDLMADAGFARRYADHDVPPPDHLRRPIPLRQLAREIDAPFVTVRRRVEAMRAAGDIVVLPAGLIVPAATLARLRYQENNAIIVRNVRQMLRDVMRITM